MITTLLLIALLTGILLEFNYAARMTTRTTRSAIASGRANHCAIAGLNLAIEIVANGLPEDDLEIQLAGGTCHIRLIGENGKIDVNSLKKPDGSLDRGRIDRLLRLIDVLNKTDEFAQVPLSYGIVPALIDWTDADDDVTFLPFIGSQNTGAESFYYQQLARPYSPSNRPFVTTDELLLSRGVTADLLYGSAGLADYITVYGSDKIDINFAPAEVIQSLSESITGVIARLIVDYRNRNRFESIERLKDVPGVADNIYSSLKPHITTRPTESRYTVIAVGKVDTVDCTIQAVLSKRADTGRVDIVYYTER